MNQTVIDLINAERDRQDTIRGNSNNHSDFVWTALIVKQLGQAIESGQAYLNATNDDDLVEIKIDRLRQILQATALCVAWLEYSVIYDPLD